MSNDFIICLLGGWFGLHYFVKGNWKKGLLYLFTIGLFGIGWFVDLIIVYNHSKKIQIRHSNNSTIDNLKKEDNFIKKIDFNVAGVTFDNRQNVINKILHEALTNGDISYTYNGLTNKEIIDENCKVHEFEYVNIPTIRLKPSQFEEKDAIEVYISDFDDIDEYMIGYVPKKEIDNVINFLQIYKNHPEYKVKKDVWLTGGKYKDVVYDDEKEKDVIVTGEDYYGINVILKLYDK